MRITLDTNVLVSATASRGLCADVFRTAIEFHELVVSEHLLEELKRILRTKFDAPEDLIADSRTEKSPATTGQEKNHSFTQELSNATQNLNPNQVSPANATNGPQVADNLRQVEAPTHEIRTPVSTQGWGDEVGQKLSWIANSTGGRAELILTPPHM